MTIGERIRAARERRGMDHQDLALKASLNAWEIAVFENGAAVILVPTLIRLCDALNVSADWLLGRTDDIDAIPLPRELTAENGAKAALIGDFFERMELTCFECRDDDEPREDCEICEGTGWYMQEVPIQWDTIKAIWKAAVAHFENETNAKPPDFKS